MASYLMLQGTASSVGKSLLVAALCRIFRQDGLRVAPFKAQNMALNAYVTPEGGEIGRAQAVQAEAAGLAPTVDMNPVLLKPEADSRCQVIVRGKVAANLSAAAYFAWRERLRPIIAESLERLAATCDVVVIEGAGSPAEINLKDRDLANMWIAQHARAPVVLVGDIDRGGVFAALVGTLELLDADERALVRGLLVNKFRGDLALLRPGLDVLEARTGKPVYGVIPYIHGLRIAEEDSVALETRGRGDAERGREGDAGTGSHGSTSIGSSPPRPLSSSPPLLIAVVRLPHIANFDDFDALAAETDVDVRFVTRPRELDGADLVVLPGSKTTVSDLDFVRQSGLAERIIALAAAGTPVAGICGGYQMLGVAIHDPDRVESTIPTVPGLGLLPLVTTFERVKATYQARAIVTARTGLLAGAHGAEIAGYEIHMGRTEWLPAEERGGTFARSGSPPAAAVWTAARDGGRPTVFAHDPSSETPFEIRRRGGVEVRIADGALARDGWIVGTYLHGLFDNDAVRASVLDALRARRGLARAGARAFSRAAEYDRLAEVVRASADLGALYRLIGR